MQKHARTPAEENPMNPIGLGCVPVEDRQQYDDDRENGGMPQHAGLP